MGAWASGADPAAEDAAVVAALMSGLACAAAGAFVDRMLAAGTDGGDDDGLGRVLVPSAERGLATARAAVGPPPGRGEGLLADRAAYRPRSSRDGIGRRETAGTPGRVMRRPAGRSERRGRRCARCSAARWPGSGAGSPASGRTGCAGRRRAGPRRLCACRSGRGRRARR